MRALGAVLVLLLAVPPAGAQTDNAISPAGVAAKPAAQTSKFRNPAIRPAALRGRPAIQRAQPPAQAPASAAARRRRVPAGGSGSAKTCAHAAGTGARRRHAPGRPHGRSTRSRLVRRLQRPGQWRDQRQDHGRHQDVPARSQVEGNRRPEPAGTRLARRRGESQAGAGRLEHGRRCRHRRAHRTSGQAGAEQDVRARMGLAGLRRKARSRSKRSRSGSPARPLRRYTSNKRKSRRRASSRSISCAPISSSWRACRT